MNKQFKILLMAALMMPLTSSAADIYFAGGISQASQSNSVSAVATSTKSYTGYGVLGGFMLSSEFGINTGFLYTEMGGHNNVGATTSFDEKAPYYTIPIMAEWWFSPNFGLGGGLYYGFSAGNITDTGTSNGSNSFGAANYANSDYGLAVNGQFAYPVTESFKLTAEAIWEYGLANVSTANNVTLNNYSILGLVGVGYHF